MKIGVPLHTPVLLHKSGVQGGIYYTDMFPDENGATLRESVTFLPTNVDFITLKCHTTMNERNLKALKICLLNCHLYINMVRCFNFLAVS